MGLLDFDDTYVPPFRPSRGTMSRATQERQGGQDNFEALQGIGRSAMSEDFEDSRFADRKPVSEDV